MIDLIDEYARHLSDLRRAESTQTTYVETLRLMDRELPYGLLSACEDELRDWIFGDGRADNTIRLYRIIANGFFEWARSRDPSERGLDFNPVADLPKVRAPEGRPNPVAQAQKTDLLLRAGRPFRDWYLIACLTGARCTEIANLDREDIKQRRVLLHGKGDKDRLVPTVPAIWELAQVLPPGPVAVDRSGVRLSRKQVSSRGNYHLQRTLGLDGVHMHRLRSTFGTEVYARTRDVMVVRKLLGHANVSTTQIYIGIDDEALERAVAGLRAV